MSASPPSSVWGTGTDKHIPISAVGLLPFHVSFPVGLYKQSRILPCVVTRFAHQGVAAIRRQEDVVSLKHPVRAPIVFCHCILPRLSTLYSKMLLLPDR